MTKKREPTKLGRPTKLKDARPRPVLIDREAVQAATELGDGNISSGIRRALELFLQQHPPKKHGRPDVSTEYAKQRNIVLDKVGAERASKIGEGIVSAGVRIALHWYATRNADEKEELRLSFDLSKSDL